VHVSGQIDVIEDTFAGFQIGDQAVEVLGGGGRRGIKGTGRTPLEDGQQGGKLRLIGRFITPVTEVGKLDAFNFDGPVGGGVQVTEQDRVDRTTRSARASSRRQ